MFLLRTQKLKISFFFFNDTATTEIYTLSLHDALPICPWTDDAFLNADWSIPSSGISGIAVNDVSGKVNFTWIDVARGQGPRALSRCSLHNAETQRRERTQRRHLRLYNWSQLDTDPAVDRPGYRY